MSSLPPASQEQEVVLEKISQCNIVVRAVAGAGKTTCILHLANKYSLWNILLLTYNTNLKNETRNRAHSLGVNNLQIHTYHSFINSEQLFCCHNDIMFENFLLAELEWVDNKYDLLILDEAQDINCLRWRLIRQILRKNGKPLRMCLLGDPLQSIYRFVYDDPADTRFMGIAEDGQENTEILRNIYPEVQDLPWLFCHFSTSYRLTSSMSKFLTECTPCQAKITPSEKNKDYPIQYYCRTYVVKILQELLEEYEQDDILILSYSQRNNKVISKITSNMFDVNFYIPLVNDDIGNQHRLHANKIVCLTYHQSKGLERPVVIITDFNYPHPGIVLTAEKIPNPYYVAFTRARERLLLIQDNGKNFLPFVKKAEFTQASYIELNSEIPTDYSYHSTGEIFLTVTQLIRHKTHRQLSKLVKMAQISTYKHDWSRIYLQSIVSQGKIFEDVSNLNGIVIPCLLEFTLKGYISLPEYCAYKQDILIRSRRKDMAQKINNYYQYHKLEEFSERKIKEIDGRCLKQLVKLALLTEACESCYLHRLRQVRYINWLRLEKCQDLLLRMKQLPWIDQNSRFESSISCQVQNINIDGRCDVVSLTKDGWLVVYEFKCLSGDLSDEHRLQLITYLAVMRQDGRKEKILGILINILSGEVEYITLPGNEGEILQILVDEYLRGEPPIESDEEFYQRLRREFSDC